MTESMVLGYILQLEEKSVPVESIIGRIDRAEYQSDKWEIETGRRTPRTLKIRDGEIEIDGSADDWINVPVYYKGITGDAKNREPIRTTSRRRRMGKMHIFWPFHPTING